MVDGPKLDLESYAVVIAHIRYFSKEPPRSVVARLGVNEADWASAGTWWLGRLAEEVEGDQATTLAQQFAIAYSAAMSSLKNRRPPLNELGAAAPAADVDLDGEVGRESSVAAHLSVMQVSNDAAVMPAPPLAPATTVGETSDEFDFDSTLEAVLREGSTLPFGVKASEEFEIWLHRGALEQTSVPSDAEELGTGTVMLPLTSVRVPAPALPFGSGTASGRMPIAQYASFCAALTVFPGRAAEIFRRFGVDGDHGKLALDQAWQETFSASPTELAKWHELYSHFCTAMVTRG